MSNNKNEYIASQITTTGFFFERTDNAQNAEKQESFNFNNDVRDSMTTLFLWCLWTDKLDTTKSALGSWYNWAR